MHVDTEEQTLTEIIKEECCRIMEENNALTAFNNDLQEKLHIMSSQV